MLNIDSAINKLHQELAKNPAFGSFITDFNYTDAYPDIRYVAAGIDLGTWTVSDRGIVSLNLSIYCFDRQQDEPSDNTGTRQDNNYLPVISKCFTVLKNALDNLDGDVFTTNDFTYQPFTHKFKDDCAGVIAMGTLVFPYSLCTDEF